MQTQPTQHATATLRPVLVSLPRDLSRRARVERFRASGRQALESAARAASAPALGFGRDEEGAPLAEGAWRWSLSNAEGLVAAVVAAAPVGIDVEPLDRPRRESLLAYLRERDAAGLDQMGADGAGALFLWTAFEAALKLLGRGVSGLPETTLETRSVKLPENWRSVRVGARSIPVWSSERKDHVVSVALDVPIDRLPRIAPLQLDSPELPVSTDPLAATLARMETSA